MTRIKKSKKKKKYTMRHFYIDVCFTVAGTMSIGESFAHSWGRKNRITNTKLQINSRHHYAGIA